MDVSPLQRIVVIDTDPGIDDALALWMALASPELDIVAVLATAGNVGLDRSVANAVSIVALAQSAVPVHAGAAWPLAGTASSGSRAHVGDGLGADGLGGVVLPPGPPPSAERAVTALRDRLRQTTVPITIVGLGPVTNIALALAVEPGLAARIDEVLLMSGAAGTGNGAPAVEFNAGTDPEALAIVLAAGRTVTFATLDLTRQACLAETDIEDLAGSDGRCAQAAVTMLRAVRVSPSTQDGGRPVHDACAIAWLLRPALFTARTCYARVVLEGAERGRTIFEPAGGVRAPNARLLETIDRGGFLELLRERLARLP